MFEVYMSKILKYYWFVYYPTKSYSKGQNFIDFLKKLTKTKRTFFDKNERAQQKLICVTSIFIKTEDYMPIYLV